MQINETFFKYKLYESALETGNEDLYNEIIKEGILGDLFSKLKGLFSKEDQVEVEQATEELEKPIATIVQKLKAAGKSPEDIKAFVNNVIEKVLTTAPARGGSSGGARSSVAGVPSGTPVSAGSEQGKTAIAAAAADLSGKNVEKEVEKSADLEMKAVLDAAYNIFAQKSGVSVEKVRQIVDYVMKNKLLQSENRLATVDDLRVVINEHIIQENSYEIMKRWQTLAGINESLILEEKFSELVKNFTKLAPNRIQGILKNKGFQDQLAKLGGPAKAEFDKLIKDVAPDGDLSKIVDAGKQKIADFLKSKFSDSASEDKGQGDQPSSPEAEKKFGKLAVKMIGRLKGVKKPEIEKVLKVIDDSSILKVNAG